MTNVLHIIRHPQIGGAEILIKNIVNSNNNCPFNHFIFYKEVGKLFDLISPEKKEYLIKSNARTKSGFIIDLRKTIRKFNIKIIHTHQPIDVIYSAIAILWTDVKIIRTYHGFSGFRSGGTKTKQRFINFITNRYVCLNLYVSNALLEHFNLINSDQMPSKQRVLYNGIDMEGLKKKTESGIRQNLNLNERSLLMGMVGSFNTEGRDQYTICEALKLLLPDYPEVHFIFIGGTNATRSDSFQKCYNFCLDNKMLNNIHFLGERKDIGELLNSLDLYVHSSNYETFGLALVEAMACGIPCIASDIPAFREVSDNGCNITMFEKGNTSDLVKKIALFIKNRADDSTKETIGRAMNYVQERFTIKTHLMVLHSLYEECVR